LRAQQHHDAGLMTMTMISGSMKVAKSGTTLPEKEISILYNRNVVYV
jgi:hypothetical protein